MPPNGDHRPRLVDLAILSGIAAACLLVFGQVASFPFVNYDDPTFLAGNPAIRNGLSAEGLRFALAFTGDAGWIPLTWISRMVDVSLFGFDPGAHHLVNLLFHVLAAGALFRFLRRSTGRRWESALVASLFALHPLHVESVAWAMERKDVLSALFGFLALDAYASRAKGPAPRRIGATALFLVPGLMAKPMLVTFPFVLLLVDLWPLRRLRPPGAADPAGSGDPQPFRRLVAEKVPLLLLSAAFAAASLSGQGAAGAVSSFGEVPAGVRLANALAACVAYLGKFAFPAGLSVHYPHPGASLPAWKAVAAGAAISAATMAAVLGARRRPWLPFGWFWYLGTLVPVAGIVQVGSQGMADRYTYIPLVGIFVIVAWGGGEIAGRAGIPNSVRAVAAGAWLLALSAASFVQTSHWRSSEALFGHALESTRGNWLAHNQYGRALALGGRNGDASIHFREALRLRPDYPEALHNLGDSLTATGNHAEAAARYREASRLAPDAATFNNLGLALLRTGGREEAVERFRDAVRLDPRHAGARHNLGLALLDEGRVAEAEEALLAAKASIPDSAEIRNALGVAFAARGKSAEAAAEFRDALRLRPGYPEARANLERFGDRAAFPAMGGGGSGRSGVRGAPAGGPPAGPANP